MENVFRMLGKSGDARQQIYFKDVCPFFIIGSQWNRFTNFGFIKKILLGTSFQLGIKSKELSMEEAQSTWKDRLRMFSECQVNPAKQDSRSTSKMYAHFSSLGHSATDLQERGSSLTKKTPSKMDRTQKIATCNFFKKRTYTYF